MTNLTFDYASSHSDLWSAKALGLFEVISSLWPGIRDGLERFDEASCLLEKAEISDEYCGKIDPLLLLCGYLTEILLKAVCVYKSDNSLVNDKGKFTLATHDQVALAQRAGIPVTPEEKKFLEVLKEYVVWAGRYPIAKNAASTRDPGPEFGPNLIDRISRLALKVLHELDLNQDLHAKLLQEQLRRGCFVNE